MRARYRDPRVIPIEIWDVLIDGVPLYRIARDIQFGRALARGVECLLSGSATNEAGEGFPDACREIERVVLTGGGAREIVWPSTRLHVGWADELDHAAAAGGRVVLASKGADNGLVVDIGQSRLKISSNARRDIYVRDVNEIPISLRPIDGRGRAELVAFVAQAIKTTAAGTKFDGAVCALPCAVDDSGALGTCTYPWRADDEIVTEIAHAAGLLDIPVWLVNDAELAAIGIACQSTFAGTTLVLTVGFGIGAALIRARR
jgi:hypothetical protein